MCLPYTYWVRAGVVMVVNDGGHTCGEGRPLSRGCVVIHERDAHTGGVTRQSQRGDVNIKNVAQFLGVQAAAGQQGDRLRAQAEIRPRAGYERHVLPARLRRLGYTEQYHKWLQS